jgi:hypothetical protein
MTCSLHGSFFISCACKSSAVVVPAAAVQGPACCTTSSSGSRNTSSRSKPPWPSVKTAAAAAAACFSVPAVGSSAQILSQGHSQEDLCPTLQSSKGSSLCTWQYNVHCTGSEHYSTHRKGPSFQPCPHSLMQKSNAVSLSQYLTMRPNPIPPSTPSPNPQTWPLM